MIHQRATQVHQKEERRREILAAALELFRTSHFLAITMAEIAEKSRLGKGTIYIYFNTKEKLFLTLAEEGFLDFFEAMDEGLNSSKDPMSSGSLTTLVGQALDSSPQLPRLLSILHTVLEHNVDRLAILKFREFLANRATRTGRNLENRLPFLSPGQGLELMLQIHVLVVGAWQVTDPAPVVKGLLDAPGLQIFATPFKPFFERSLMALIRGLEHARNFEPQRSLFNEVADAQG